MNLEGELRPADAVETSLVEDRAVLFHRDSGEALVLNPSASLLWIRLDSKAASLDDLTEVLEQQFGLRRDQARGDAAEFIEQLRDGDWLAAR